MDDSTRVVEEFHEAVNMTPADLEQWLATIESREAGETAEGGRVSGRRIVEILRKSKRDYTNGDIEHMRNVVGYIQRLLVQWQAGDGARWATGLKNCGHDPAKP